MIERKSCISTSDDREQIYNTKRAASESSVQLVRGIITSGSEIADVVAAGLQRE